MSRILGGIREWAEESLIGKKLGRAKGAHYQLPATSSFPLPGPTSLSQAELNLITSSEYIINRIYGTHACCRLLFSGFMYVVMLDFCNSL